MEWCTRQLLCSSFLDNSIISIAYNHHTDIYPLYLSNTDDVEYGGAFTDLKETVIATRKAKPKFPPACICKDIIIHPVQIAQALEEGASGVLLIMAVVGGDLETLLDSCTCV